MTVTKISQSLINHVVFVLDGSGSMRNLKQAVIDVFDGQIAWLAKRSREMDQETRVTVYVFDGTAECVIFDKDVLRLPSIRDLYWVRGSTALIKATMKSQEELAQTCTLYGDHAFLTFVLTDGGETDHPHLRSDLARMIGRQGDNWTVAVLVPNQQGKTLAHDYGFPKGNIEIWDVNSATGVAEAGEVIQKATDTYFESRASGVRGSKTLFAGSAQQINAQTVAAAGLTALDSSKYVLVPVVPNEKAPLVYSGKETRAHPNRMPCVEIGKFVRSIRQHYDIGRGYYELTKSEEIGGNKDIAVVEAATGRVYVGAAARKLIGLGDVKCRVRPMPIDSSGKPPFKIFVQSQSDNRHLPKGSTLLYMI